MRHLQIKVLDTGISVASACPDAYELLRGNFAAMDRTSAPADLCFDVERPAQGGYTIRTPESGVLSCPDTGDLLYQLEGEITVTLQRRRPDLFFLHAAALEHKGRGVLLSAPSGSGKSTTAWALVQLGLGYLSDELAPVDLARMEVHPYPHALCLKQDPPPPYTLPASTLVTSRSLHVPVAAFGRPHGNGPVPLEAAFFLRYRGGNRGPALQAISPAAGAAHLYANALNALAHPGDGLDAAVQVATACRCFELDSGDLAATAKLILDILDRTD
jgi:hypothetical protein